jgi:hypothetical protein
MTALQFEEKRRYFLDTEFIDNGCVEPVHLISLALVCEDGREYYAELADVPMVRAGAWVRTNVVPHLTGQQKTREGIKRDICDFFPREELKPEIWGYFCDYDWVLFCQIFGPMIALPGHLPHHCMDLRQLQSHLGVKKEELPVQASTKHNALYDARWNAEVFRFLQKKAT